ncbi:MAG TPA: cysteine hydrolase family protein [Candidatus Binataceae bacterium]|jgi:nicotinamidase/pyrazinamidase|nr:cysteine hydrolase family protein [Candidatus Binataceae bacterium]
MSSQKKLRPERILFYDVDTQRDFMLPGGALYVPGSEKILPALRDLTELARRRRIRRICSTDRHFRGDRELARNGGKWPDHCMDGTPGQRKVDETAPSDPHPLPAHPVDPSRLETALGHRGELIIEKQDVDVIAGNANARSLLSHLAKEYDHVVIYGVYTDVCVDHAVNALLEHGHVPYVVMDAIHEIDPDSGAAARARWRRRGVKTITRAQLEDLLDD